MELKIYILPSRTFGIFVIFVMFVIFVIFAILFIFVIFVLFAIHQHTWNAGMRERKLLNGEGSKEEGEGKYPISRYPMGPTKNSFLGIAQIVAGGISQPKLFWTHYFNSINGKTFNNQKRNLGL